MRTIFPELKKLQPGGTAIVGCDPESGEIEWTVVSRHGSILELISRRPVTGEWLSQHGEGLTSAGIARLLREKWLPERLDWIEMELARNCEGMFLPCAEGSGVLPVLCIDLSALEPKPKEEDEMLYLDTAEQLIKYGMEPRRAHLLTRKVLPVQLDIPNDLRNLEQLASLTDLNLCDPDRLKAFLLRDHRINQRMEVVPKWFSFSPEQAAEYMRRPLEWSRDIYDGLYAREHLKLLTDDEEVIRRVIVSLYTCSTFCSVEKLLSICQALARINTDQAVMDRLLADSHIFLFSDHSFTESYIRLLEEKAGPMHALERLA